MHHPLFTLTGALFLNVAAFIPSFTRALVRGRPKEALELTASLAIITAATLFLITTVLYAIPGRLLPWITPEQASLR